jgi:hypothetical protein
MRRGPDGSRAEVEDRRITRWFPVIRGTTDTSLPILELLARRDLFAGHSAVPIGSVTRPRRWRRTGPYFVVQAPSFS